jgi:hypothetical protein
MTSEVVARRERLVQLAVEAPAVADAGEPVDEAVLEVALACRALCRAAAATGP